MKADIEVPENDPPNKRLKSELRVQYGPSHQTELSCFSVDLNTGRLYLKTETPFAVDESLMLHFSLPEINKTVSCKARVAWINRKDKPGKPELPPGIGIQFVDLSLEDMKSIRRFLEHNEIVPVWE